jgi:predicted transcriptional regulator
MSEWQVSGSGGQDKASEVSIYLDTQRGAVVMLQQRIKIIRNYLRDVRDGKLERNNELLRLLSALCSRLPITTDGDSGGASFLENANDSMLVRCSRRRLFCHLHCFQNTACSQ